MKKIIVLCGNPDSGKSTTLKEVVRELLKRGARIIDCSNNFGHWKHQTRANIGDIWVLLEYESKKIFIYTAGDYPKMIDDVLDEIVRCSGYALQDIDDVIFAAHPSFVDSISKSVANKMGGASIVVVNKRVASLESQQKKFNSNDARDIIAAL